MTGEVIDMDEYRVRRYERYSEQQLAEEHERLEFQKNDLLTEVMMLSMAQDAILEEAKRRQLVTRSSRQPERD